LGCAIDCIASADDAHRRIAVPGGLATASLNSRLHASICRPRNDQAAAGIYAASPIRAITLSLSKQDFSKTTV